MNAFLIVDPTEKNERIIQKFAVGSFNTGDVIRKRDWITAEYQDEIGKFSRRIKDIMAYLRGIDTCIQKVAAGDLTAEVPVCSSEDQIGNSLSDMVTRFHGLVTSIVSATDQVNSGAALVSNSSQTLAQGASQQASTVEELTASLEQISQQTKRNAENARQVNDIFQ